MNLNTTNLSIVPCLVCDYLFSDKHHIWPQAKGGETLPTINLCPNHHRYANIVQAMLLQGRSRGEIERFAVQHFDRAFNETMLPFLVSEQLRISWQGWSRYYAQMLSQACEVRDRGAAMAAWMELGLALLSNETTPHKPLSDDEREKLAHVWRCSFAGADLPLAVLRTYVMLCARMEQGTAENRNGTHPNLAPMEREETP